MATGTTITTYSDREFLFRLQTLVIDGGTGVLRNIFDQRLQNQPLNTVLASEQSTVNRLVRHGTLTRAQYNLLYPSSGQPPTTSNFDITLIVCLLRNLPSLGCNQNYNWNVPPQTGDTSVEADVWRLRAFRNEIAHISSTTGFQQSSFQSKWCEIESVLLRLDQNSPTPNFSQTIDSYKYSAMDPANEKRIRTMIEQWQERDLGLETDMQLIKKDVGVLKKDFSDTKEDVKSIKKGSSDTKEDIKSIKDNFSDTKEDVKSIKKDFGDTKEYVKSIKEDFSNTKEDVKSIKKDFSDTKEDVKSITKGLSDTQDDVNSMKKDVSDTKDEVKSIKKDVSELKQGDLSSSYVAVSAENVSIFTPINLV